MKELAYIDGTFIDLKEYAVQLEDRGYQLGDGVYETLRVYDGVCFGVKKHLERYRNSMRALNIP
ncbi:MAG: amino acid aminotransferase, partial [Schwartzia succinivorans]|nr:amino acid aminotransferase [Schwartzia succinivorans]